MGMNLDETKKFLTELSKKNPTPNKKAFVDLRVTQYVENQEFLGQKVDSQEKSKVAKEAEIEFNKIQKDLQKIRQIISKDFDNSFFDYMEYLLLHKHLEKQGSKFYGYIRILEKTKSVDRCLDSISLDHIKQLKTDTRNLAHVENSVISSSEYGHGLSYLVIQNGSDDFARKRLIDKIDARIAELEKEEQQFDTKTKKRLMEIINKGKFIDATVELEKIFEDGTPIDQSFAECLNAYVNLGGPQGCESIQRELREITKRISKGDNGELYVDLHASTYRQLRNKIEQLQERFKDQNKTLDRDTTVYRGIDRDGLLKLLKSNSINISEEDFTLDNVSSKIKGKTFIDKAFMSTSESKEIAEEFATSYGKLFNDENLAKTDEKSASGAIFEIELKKGTSMIDINKELKTKQFEREKEILLPDNTKLKVYSTEKYKVKDYSGEKIRYLLWIKASIVQ